MKTTKTLIKSGTIYIRLWVTLLFLFVVNASYTQGRVLINEYLAWPANSCSVTSEYIELYNFGPGPTNIGCYIITDGDFSITIPSNTIIQPGQFYVIAGQNTLPLGCANGNLAVTVDLNWNTCNCTSAPIPTTGSGLMTDGGSGSEQLVLFDPGFKVVDAVVRNLSESSSAITTSSASGQCTPYTFNLDTMNIQYEMIGQSQGRANSFARRINGGCGWLKDPQQSGGASNNTPGASSELDASLSITAPMTCTNTGGAAVYVNSGNYSQIFPMKYILARDVDSNNIYDFTDNYSYGADSTSSSVPVTNLVPGIYKMVVETANGCDLTSFNFNILGCNSGILDIEFSFFELVTFDNKKFKLSWNVGNKEEVQSFMIQKSADGINFTPHKEIFNVTDPSFNSGYYYEGDVPGNAEYYRVQLITKDGKKRFSTSKKLFLSNPLVGTIVFPNPFKDKFTVSIPASNLGSITMFIYDIFGRIVRKEQMETNAGNNSLLVNADLLHPGIYVIQLRNKLNQNISTSRILKISN